MDFFVYSRLALEAARPHDEAAHLIISIRTPGDPDKVKLPLSKRTLGVLHMEFHDIDRGPHWDDDATATPEVLEYRASEKKRWKDRIAYLGEDVLFNPKMAAELVGFVRAERPEPVERIIVHCDAGLSRSPAVAAALSRVLDGDDDAYFKRYRPNMKVYRGILDAWGLPPVEEPEDDEPSYVGQTRWNADRTEWVKVQGCYGIGSRGLLYSVTFPNSNLQSINGMSAKDLDERYPNT